MPGASPPSVPPAPCSLRRIEVNTRLKPTPNRAKKMLMPAPLAAPAPALQESVRALPELTQRHLERTSAFYDAHNRRTNWAGRHYQRTLAHYLRHAIPENASILEVGCGHGELLRHLPNRDVTGIDVSTAQIEHARENIPYGTFHVQAGENLYLDRSFDVILVSDTINEAADVQAFFTALRRCARPDTRLVFTFFNNFWRPALDLASACGIKAKRPPNNWLSRTDVQNLLRLGGWELVKLESRVLCPLRLGPLERIINAGLAPLVPWAGLVLMGVARMPVPRMGSRGGPKVSVIVPARNEAGNIENAVRRTPELGAGTELIFIEGNSKDDTWERIQQAVAEHPERTLVALRQSGKGKGNAVREAFAAATGDILMILDADLTMPPEELPKFVHALVSGQAEFVNGARLVYPMGDRAMRFLNMLGNHAFSVLFSWLLAQPVRDTLCGTKVLYRRDYERIAAQRSYFGDFDPFGDFDLLFGASRLNLKILDIPIRYQNREYGDTNINRWSHGLLLLRMVAFASRKLKFI